MVCFGVLILLLTLFGFSSVDTEKCPEGSYVKAIDVSVDSARKLLTAVQLSCVQLQVQVENNNFEVTKSLTSYNGSTGEFTGREFCYRGLAMGFKKRATPTPLALNDVVLIYANGSGMDFETRAKGVDDGTWDIKTVKCSAKTALCGLKTVTTKPGGTTFLTNISPECCALPEPVETCLPTDDWLKVLNTDNRMAKDSTKLSYGLKMGVEIIGVRSSSVLDEIAAYHGFELDDTVISSLGIKFESILSTSEKTGHTWSRTDTSIFTKYKSPQSLELTLAADYEETMQQVIGKCGPYVVWTNTFKRVDSGGFLSKCSFTVLQLIAIVLVLNNIV